MDRRSPGRYRLIVGTYPLRQLLMNFLRSSPFLSPAFLLQAVIFSCCVILAGSASLPDKHELMNFLRSSPFFSPAFALHSFIRSCCEFAGGAPGAGAVDFAAGAVAGAVAGAGVCASDSGATTANAPASDRASKDFIRVSCGGSSGFDRC